MKETVFTTKSPEETSEIGRKLATELSGSTGDDFIFILLTGDLGAGKTAFTLGVADVLSPGSRVKSPSYTIVNEYRKGPVPLFHFDLYRLGEDADLSEIGFSDYLTSGHCIIEWSEYFNEEIPENAVFVNISGSGDSDRIITVKKPY